MPGPAQKGSCTFYLFHKTKPPAFFDIISERGGQKPNYQEKDLI